MRIPYRIYKQGYSEFPASDYDKSTKTIDVQLPEYKKPTFPKEWGAGGCKHFNHVTMYVRNSGFAEYYEIHQTVRPYKEVTIECGLYAREKAIATFKELMIMEGEY